ncbi:MAG: helix-turn-helix transcriptional regulator [Gammaproteobacteria bacterium]
MDRFDRIYELHKILRDRRTPISRKDLEDRLECSRATVKRIIEDMRDFLGAPIVYDRQYNGYIYGEDEGGHPYELPGLWFNASELYALLASQQLLSEAQPGLLDQQLKPLRERIDQLLQQQHLGSSAVDRILITRVAGRRVNEDVFGQVAGALLQGRRLDMTYRGRERDDSTERQVSPQRLVHYRDNWYLDAWCHLRKGLRSFAVDRIVHSTVLADKAKDLEDVELDAHFRSAYGIFSGAADKTAVLRFSAERARWVADEHWHPAQSGAYLDDGRYELRIPYHDPRELIMDVLRHGAQVEVMEPEALRRQVRETLSAALAPYGDE